MNVIVSLTTTSYRAMMARHACLSLAEQRRPPDRILLNVSREPYLFDQGFADDAALGWTRSIPSLEVNWVPNDGSYRKLLPALLSAQPDDIIVTCDDDVLFAAGWLEQLLSVVEEQPRSVVCGRGRRLRRNLLGRPQSYFNWRNVPGGSCGGDILPIGSAGVCYRPWMIPDPLALGDFRELAPTADDIWFWGCTRLLDLPVVVAPGVVEQTRKIQDPSPLARHNNNKRFGGWSSKFLDILIHYGKIPTLYYLGLSAAPNDRAVRAVLQRLSLQRRAAAPGNAD